MHRREMDGFRERREWGGDGSIPKHSSSFKTFFQVGRHVFLFIYFVKDHKIVNVESGV